MRHLHLEFICASFSLGLSVFLLGMSSWQFMLFVDGARGVFLPLWFTLVVSLATGVTLFRHAVTGIREEIHHPRKRHGS